MLPISSTFYHAVIVKNYCLLSQKNNKTKQVHYKNQAVKLTARCIHGGKLSIFHSFPEKIIRRVLSTAVFYQFLLIPRPYMHNFSGGETLTLDLCPNLFCCIILQLRWCSKHFTENNFLLFLWEITNRSNNFVRGVYYNVEYILLTMSLFLRVGNCAGKVTLSKEIFCLIEAGNKNAAPCYVKLSHRF